MKIIDFFDFIIVKLQRMFNIKKTRLPFVYLDVTNQCNSPCKTCSIWKNKKDDQELKTQEYLQLIPDLKKLNTKVISIAGGEPFLRDDILFLVNQFSQFFKVHIITNGSLLSKEKIDQLEYAGLTSLCFSIDATDKELYYKIRGLKAFDHIYEMLKYSNSKNFSTHVNLTISQLNVDFLDKIVNDLIQLKPDKIQFIIATNNQQQSNMSDTTFNNISIKEQVESVKLKLLQYLKKLENKGIQTNSKEFILNIDKAFAKKWKYSCYAGDLFTIIDYAGNVAGCYDKGFVQNIRKSTLVNILNSKDYKIMTNKVKECTAPCHDNGKAEPSLRMNMKYNIKNLYKSLKEFNKI